MPTHLTKDHMERMRIPRLHHACTLQAIPDTCQHKAHVLSYIDALGDNLRDGVGLMLFGDYSSGKSGLGSILLKAAASSGRIGLWIAASRIPGYYINGDVFDEHHTMIERAVAAPLLMIDEVILFGDKRDWHLERLVRDRIGLQRATIVTTNLSPAKFKNHYSALAAVMQEAIIPIHVDGHDFRADIKERLQGKFEAS